MRVLLLNPPSPLGSTADRRQRCTVKSPRNWVHPPIALAYLASCLKKWNGTDVKLIDAVIEDSNIEQIIEELDGFNPDLIISPIGSYSFNWDFEQLAIAKKALKCSIAVFGEAPTVFADKFLRDYHEIDFCILGEAELALSELVKFLEGKKELREVPGIAYHDDKEIRMTPRKIIDNLDIIPFPARELLKNERYHGIPFFSGLFTDINTSRGCPYRCKFCTTNEFWGNTYRSRSPQNVLDEVRECVEKFGIKKFFIPDETFGANRKWLKEVMNGFRGFGIEWALQTRVNLVDREMLQNMAESGCVYIHYGAESGSQKMLDYYNKQITVDQIKNAFMWSHEVGIETNATFIIGNPEETNETAQQTIDLAREIKADYYHFSPLIPVPASEFFREFEELNLLRHHDFIKYVKPHIVFKPKHMTDKEINDSLKKAYRVTVMSPSYALRRLWKVIKKGDWTEFKILFYGGWWTLKTFLFKK